MAAEKDLVITEGSGKKKWLLLGGGAVLVVVLIVAGLMFFGIIGFLMLGFSDRFLADFTAGRGWIVVVALIAGNWRPRGVRCVRPCRRARRARCPSGPSTGA